MKFQASNFNSYTTHKLMDAWEEHCITIATIPKIMKKKRAEYVDIQVR